jgi:hypothetical protein
MPWPHEGPRRECRGCKQEFPLTREHFGRHQHGRDGYHPHCRTCCRTRKKAQRAREAERRAGIRPPLPPGQLCDECCGLGHRRPFAGCPRCGLAYVLEPPVELVTRRAYEPAVAI